MDRERKQAAYEAKRQADKDAKLASQLEAELEAADFPAYADEINTCTTLIAFFEGVLDPSKKMSGGVTVMTKESTTAVAASNLRQVDNSMPEGVVLLKKKDDRDEEDYYFSNKKKSGKGAKGKGVSSSDSTTTSNASSKSLKLDIVMMSQLAKLSIDIPSSTADVERVIGALAAKKSNYETNQATKTAENKKRALEKITALKGRIAAGEDVNAVLDSAAATETEVEAN